MSLVWLSGCAEPELQLDPEEYSVTGSGLTFRFHMVDAVGVAGDEVEYSYDVKLENEALHAPGLRLSVSTADPGIQLADTTFEVGQIRHGMTTHVAAGLPLQRDAQGPLDPRALQWTFGSPAEKRSVDLGAADAAPVEPLTNGVGPALTAIGEYFLVRYVPRQVLPADWTEATFDVEVEATGLMPLPLHAAVSIGDSPGQVVQGELLFEEAAMGTTSPTNERMVIRAPQDVRPKPDQLDITVTAGIPDSQSALQKDCRYPDLELSYGQMGLHEASPASDILISAPHGRYDRNTLPIAEMLATRLSANLLWAYDYRSTWWPVSGHFLNVNRPTGGFEASSEDAERVYHTYRDCAHQLPRRAYVEIHGNAGADDIQVATPDGFPREIAEDIIEQWNNVRGEPFGDMVLSIEPVDDITWSAGGTKRAGMMLDCPELCLHFELPSEMRDKAVHETTADLLAELLHPILAE